MKCKLLLAMAAAVCYASGRAQTTDGYFDSNGVKIHYATAGEGEAVVLIHGWMADSTMWGRDAAGNTKLDTSGAKGFRIIAIDCRGHGKSDKPHEQGMYGVEMANDVLRLLDYLKVKRAHFIGYSMGCFIAGKVAASNPERVLSVIYASQAPLVAGKQDQTAGSNEVSVFADAVDKGQDLGVYISAVMPADRKPSEAQASAMAKFMFNGKDVKALACAGRSLGKLEVSAKSLRRCKAPALFIYGGNESDYLKNCVVAARRVLPNSEVHVIAGGDHMTTLLRPEFAESIMQFLYAHRER